MGTKLPNGKPLIYLDNAATTQMPRPVLSAMLEHGMYRHANVHRGIHHLAEQADAAYHRARQTLADYLHVRHEELIFTRGTTESLNLLASCWAPDQLRPGEEVLTTAQEHHSNFLPWQRLCRQRDASLRILKLCPSRGAFHEALERHLHPGVKLLALAHITNVLGEERDISAICRLAHANGTKVLVDGAQSLLHGPVDLRAWDCDAFASSAHKAFGPTGIGLLFVKSSLLSKLEAYQLGGGMVEAVTAERSDFRHPPERFEAGTPNILGAIGFAAAIDFLRAELGDGVGEHEKQWSSEAQERLRGIPGLRLSPVPEFHAGILSFTMEGIHPHDIATWLNEDGIAVRAGHHCAQPLMAALGVPATVRVSWAPYNRLDELEVLEKSLHRLRKAFR
ncbi:MAG: cysteine desulfurase [Puniceicoccales bacterium]|nr:cysteine desulfurase [Puniceicoccales bacterium]